MDALDFENAAWINVDDPVMGGLSRSDTRLVELESGKAVLRFAGNVSLDNNGGFCSTRTEGKSWQASGATGFSVEVRGDGRSYKFTVRTDDHNRGSYRVSFDTSPEKREVFTFHVDEFEMYDRGRHLPDAPSLDPSVIRSVGFLVSDKQAGEFRLDIYGLRAVE